MMNQRNTRLLRTAAVLVGLLGVLTMSASAMHIAEGYETVCVLTGLGEHPAVRALFVEHARQAEQLQAEAC